MDQLEKMAAKSESITPVISSEAWAALDSLQCQVLRWQSQNFPDCQEWELALGVCEESGELAECMLKLHRGIRGDEFNEDRLKDAIGDIVVYLIGICGARGWSLGSVLESTAERVLSRDWRQT
jgi:NTP pyrophosphatase (non-canonical NTP hydrolase)